MTTNYTTSSIFGRVNWTPSSSGGKKLSVASAQYMGAYTSTASFSVTVNFN